MRHHRAKFHGQTTIWLKKIFIFFISFMACFIYSMAYSDEEVTIPSQLPEPVDVKNNPLINAKYDSATYELAYKTFLYSGNVNDAFALSLSAIKNMPNSLIWRERLVQTAVWTNHVDVALDQLTYLIEKEHQPKFLAQAIKMSSDLNRYDSLIPLLEYQYKLHPNDENIIAALGVAYDQSGQPARALQFIRKHNAANPNKKYLQIIATIYTELGDYVNTSKTLIEIDNRYGMTVKNALTLAEINYNHAKLEEALQQLMTLPQENTIVDTNFWETKAELSWLVGKDRISRQAYLKLYYLNHTSEEGMERLLLLQPKSDAHLTLKIATQTWRLYQNIEAFLKASTIAAGLRDWRTLTMLYQIPASPTARNNLMKYPDYWTGLILILQHSGEEWRIAPFLLQAVLAHPDNTMLKLIYLNYLENQLTLFTPYHQPELLFSALTHWQSKATQNDDWADVYVRSFMLMDNPKKALSVYDGEKLSRHHNVSWFISYAQILEVLKFNKSAYEVRLGSWLNVLGNLRHHDKEDYEFWGEYSELAAYFTPPVTSYSVSSYLAASNPSPYAADSLMAWTLAHNNYELAAYLAAYYYPDHIPAWIALKLAIMKNDQVQMRQMLSSMSAELPRKERVEAALKVNDIALAQTLAYDGMRHTRETERYELMVETFLQTASTGIIETEYEQFGSMQGPRMNMNAKVYLTDSLSIQPYTVLWDPRTNNAGNLASYSYFDKTLGIILGRKTNRSEVYLDIHDRDVLYNYYAAELRGEYGLTSKLTLSGRLGYNQRTTLNAFILLAGTQDRYQGILIYDWTARDRVIASLEYDNYHLQDRTSLGNGGAISGEYNHKFWLDYPDYTVQLNATINRYNHYNSLIQGPVLQIFPSDVAPTAETLLTSNFWQTGINFIFGDALREGYTHAFRPYSNIGILYASTAGYGTTVDLGVTGSLVGRDKLSFYFTRASTNQGNAQVNFLVGIHYQIYI